MEREEQTITTPEYLQVIADAAAGYRHSEIVVQQRLYNFLMAASILVLAAAATLAAAETPGRRVFLALVAVIGVFLSSVWSILGTRQKKFVDLHVDIILALEAKVSEELRATEPIARLQRGQVVEFTTLGRTSKYKLSPRQLTARASNLLVAAPVAFLLVFAALLPLAWFGWS